MIFDADTTNQSWFVWATQDYLWRVTNLDGEPIRLQVDQDNAPAKDAAGNAVRFPLYPKSTMAVKAKMIAVAPMVDGTPVTAKIEFELLE